MDKEKQPKDKTNNRRVGWLYSLDERKPNSMGHAKRDSARIVRFRVGASNTREKVFMASAHFDSIHPIPWRFF